jgi:Mycothiol maleylpyruvate isomerase N-terminal domain
MSDDIDTVDVLLARSDEGWVSFRVAIHALPPEAWDEEVPGGGWTCRKMLNHIRVWHELTASRLATFREQGDVPPLEEDDDSINARAAADADIRSRELILSNFDRSYADLRNEIVQLSDQGLTMADRWAPNVIEGNTFGHYDEHRRDLEVN